MVGSGALQIHTEKTSMTTIWCEKSTLYNRCSEDDVCMGTRWTSHKQL